MPAGRSLDADHAAGGDVVALDAVEPLQARDGGTVALGNLGEVVAAAHLVGRAGCRLLAVLGGTVSSRFAGLLAAVASALVALGRRVVARLGVTALVEGVTVGVSDAVLEVEDCLGIDCVAHKTGLEVQVRTGGTAGVAAQGDGLAGLDNLVGLHEEAREVAIDGLEAVLMAHNHVEAETVALKLGEPHLAVKGGAHCVAHGRAQVHTLVVAAETRTVAVVARDVVAVDWHTVARDVDYLARGHVALLEGVHQTAIPSLGVDIGLGLLIVVEALGVGVNGLGPDFVLHALLVGEQFVVFVLQR